MVEYIARLVLAVKANNTDAGRLIQALRRTREGVALEGDRVQPSAELTQLLERVERGEYR